MTTTSNAVSTDTVVGSIVRFPTPPLGLAPTEYLLCPVTTTRGLFTLRATSDLNLRLFLLDPTEYYPEYLPQAREAVTRAAGRELGDIAVLVVLNPGGDGEHPTANLLAPLLLDIADGMGVQTVLDDDRWQLRAPLPAS